MAENGNNKRKRIVLWIIIIAALAVFAAAVINIVITGKESADNQTAADELRDDVVSQDGDLSGEPLTPVSDGEVLPEGEDDAWWSAYALQPDKTVDFDALSAINSDTCGWITIPGTDIDYPVVYTVKRVGWYLNHSFEGEESKHGAIYMDDYNLIDFSAPVSLIYGHNMKDGSMFAQLHRFEDAQFFDENDVIRIYSPDGYMLGYEIFAACKTGDENFMALNDFTDEAVLAEYQQSIFDVRDMSANFRDIELTAEDRIVVLATCVSGEDDARYLVYGRLKENAE